MLDPVATAPGSVTPIEQLVLHFPVESAECSDPSFVMLRVVFVDRFLGQ